jgi:hypothetical protein
MILYMYYLHDEGTFSVTQGGRKLEYLPDKELMSDCEHPQSLIVFGNSFRPKTSRPT